MNQILLTNNQNIKKKSSGKYNQNNSNDMKKIIIFFAIILLIFAIIIIGMYVSKLSKKDDKDRPLEKPELSLEQTENMVKIIAKAEAGINKISYTWNDEERLIFFCTFSRLKSALERGR